MQSPWDIIRRPLVTEKAMRLVGENKYSFEVDRNANKTEIKQAIEAIFKVKVKRSRPCRCRQNPSGWAGMWASGRVGKRQLLPWKKGKHCHSLKEHRNYPFHQLVLVGN